MGCFRLVAADQVTGIQRQLSTLSRQPVRSSKAVIQAGRKCKAKESNGLAVPAAATFRTWV